MNGNNIQTQPTLTTRIKDWWNSICLFTKVSFIGCIAIFIIQSIVQVPDTQTICYSYPFVIQKFQIWRILTAPFFHANLLHLVFNMFALVSLGLMLEKKLGTVNIFTSTLLLIALCGAFQLLMTFVAVQIIPRVFDLTQDTFFARVLRDMLYECGVGFSGVLFAYLVIGIHYDPSNASQSVFGLTFCPAYAYPWILLLISSLLMVGVSFFGHLAGILAGYTLVFLIMRRDFFKIKIIKGIESRLPQRLTQLTSFILSDASLSAQQQSSSDRQQEQQEQEPVQSYTFSTSTSQGRTLGRAAPNNSSALGTAVSLHEDNSLGRDVDASSSSSVWSRARDFASNTLARVTGMFSSSAGSNSNTRSYSHLHDESDDMELPAPASIDPQHAISTRNDAGAPEEYTANDNSSNQLVLSQQQPKAAEPEPKKQQETVDSHFANLAGGRRLGNA